MNRILYSLFTLSSLSTAMICISCRSQYHEHSSEQTTIIENVEENEIDQKEQITSVSYTIEPFTNNKIVISEVKSIKSQCNTIKKSIHEHTALAAKITKEVMKQTIKTNNPQLTRNLSLVSLYTGITAFILSFIIPQVALFLVALSLLLEIIALLRTMLSHIPFDKKKVRQTAFIFFVTILVITISLVMMRR